MLCRHQRASRLLYHDSQHRSAITCVSLDSHKSEVKFGTALACLSKQRLPTRVSRVIISQTGADRAAMLRKEASPHVTFCKEYTVCCVPSCLPHSQRVEALTQVQFIRQLNMARHTPYRMSHEQAGEPLMAFCLQGISLTYSRHRSRSVSEQRGITDRGHESVRFVASHVGYLSLTNGRLRTLSRPPIRYGGIKIDVREQPPF